MTDRPRPRSLRRRLIVQLLLFQAGILIVLGTAFVAYLVRASESGYLLDPKFTEVVSRAVLRDPGGSLRLQETDELVELRKDVPDLWFIARSDAGEIVEAGEIPDVYRQLAQHLDRITFADIRDTVEPFSLLAIVRRVTGPAGDFVIIGKGGRLSTTYALVILANLLVIPILVLLAIITAIVIPVIVGRSFSRLALVAQEARTIDVVKRGYRLPESDVPSEIMPMVEAINGALQRLDDGYERQRRFILDAAHELRTPIAFLQTRLAAMPSDPFRTRLQNDAARIAGLAEQLLDMQRIDREQTHFHPLDLVALCRTVVADLAPLAIATGYELSLDEPSRAVMVIGDAGALERVVANLVQNAIEHSGGQGKIDVIVDASGTVEVADDGPGIPAAERENVFAPFHRLHPRDHGAGLGLSLAREIAHRHGGQISIVDQPRGGACFRLMLRLAVRETTVA